VEQHCVSGEHRDQDHELRGDVAPDITLPEGEEPRVESAVVDRAAGDRFGDAAEEGKRPERDD
jgi:hypothetical protein